MLAQADAFLTRVRAAASKVRDLSRLSDWICAYTTHPKDTSAPWSFEDHEMQVEIANCDAPKACVRKCSQVGLSELSVRIVLGLLNIYTNSTAIYTLPTTNFARKFAKARIDSVISGSEVLSASVNKDNDSSELKQLAGSFLYISGSFGQTSAISVPADFLIRDEVDFSNQVALSTFASRLGHAENGGITRDFSTPTVEKYGISDKYDNSTQARYVVKCDSCGKKVAPEFLNDVIIPGYDEEISKLEKSDLINPKYDINGAFVACPSCHNPLTQANLCDASKREWVHAYERGTRDYIGYQVYPYDVPKVNPVPKTLRALDEYKKKADWVNFKVGVTYEDAETSFLEEAIDRGTCLDWVMPRELAAAGCVFAMDVGKVSHMLVGKRSGVYLDVIHAERVRETGEGEVFERAYELMRMYGVVKGVIDAGPDFSTALKLITKGYHNQVFACYYVRSTRTSLANLDVKEVDQVINANRTGTLDETARAANKGQIRYARMEESATIKAHLRALKRVETDNAAGERVGSWIKTDDDHYSHTLNYLKIADSMVDYRGAKAPVPATPMMGKLKLKSVSSQPPESELIS